jgi:hypothetical protein
VSFKPSLAFFALIGIRSRAWWIAVAGIAVASLPLLSLWLLYPTVMRNSSAQFTYSLSNLPFFCLPIVAWITSTRRGSEQLWPWFVRLGRGGEPSLAAGNAVRDPSPAA